MRLFYLCRQFSRGVIALQLLIMAWEVLNLQIPKSSTLYLGYLRHLPAWTHPTPFQMFAGLAICACLVQIGLSWSVRIAPELKIHLSPRPVWVLGTASLAPLYLLMALFSIAGLERYTVPSPSMRPTLPEGAQILVWKSAFWLQAPYAGDMVVFTHQDPATHEETLYVKRVVAVGGQTVIYDFALQQLIVDLFPQQATAVDSSTAPNEVCSAERQGHLLKENLAGTTHYICLQPQEPVTWARLAEYERDPAEGPRSVPAGCTLSAAKTQLTCHVPPDSVFLMGDNRDDSVDSRLMGAIDLHNVKGKVIQVLR